MQNDAKNTHHRRLIQTYNPTPSSLSRIGKRMLVGVATVLLSGCAAPQFTGHPGVQKFLIGTDIYNTIGEKCLGKNPTGASAAEFYFGTLVPILQIASCAKSNSHCQINSPATFEPPNIRTYHTQSRHEIVGVFVSPDGWQKLTVRTDPSTIINIYRKDGTDLYHCNDRTWHESSYSSKIDFRYVE